MCWRGGGACGACGAKPEKLAPILWNIENLLCSQFCDEHTLTNIKQVFVLKQIATSISKKIHDKGMRITNNLLSHPQYVSKWDFSMTHVMRG